jgi:hypothetical protein
MIPDEKHTLDNPSYIIRLEDLNSKFGTLVLA